MKHTVVVHFDEDKLVVPVEFKRKAVLNLDTSRSTISRREKFGFRTKRKKSRAYASSDPANLPIDAKDKQKLEKKDKVVKVYEYIPEESFVIDVPFNSQRMKEDREGVITEAKFRAVEYVVKQGIQRDPKTCLELAYTAMLSRSNIAQPINISVFTNFSARFSPPPVVKPFQISAVMAIERDYFPETYFRGDCSVCSEKGYVKRCSCGRNHCANHFVEKFSTVPFGRYKCQCGLEMFLSDKRRGITGADWVYLAGHEAAPFAKSIQNWDHSSYVLTSDEVKYRNYLLHKLSEVAVFKIVKRAPKSVPVWDITERNYGEHYLPSGSVGGIEKGAGRLTKDMVSCETAAAVHNFIQELYSNSDQLPECLVLLRKWVSNVLIASIKIETICGKKTEEGWSTKEKARIFTMQDVFSYLLQRALTCPFTQTGGIRDRTDVQPCAVGMNFDSEAARNFLKEFYDVTDERLDACCTAEDGKKLEQEILKVKCVYETDARNFDQSLPAPHLVECMSKVFDRYDTRYNADDSEHVATLKKVFRLLCARFIEKIGVKVVSRLDGKGFHTLLGTMGSGSYETSFLNTVVNLTNHLMVYAHYFVMIEDMSIDDAIRKVIELLESGDIRFKMFGDDVLAAHTRELFPHWSAKFYIDTIFQLCNITIPVGEYKEATKIFVTPESQGPLPEEGVPTFLKFSLFYVLGDIGFFRHDSKSIPKLPFSSEKEITPMTFFQRCICLMWTCGLNPKTYRAALRGIRSLGVGSLTGEMEDMNDRLTRFGLTQDIFYHGVPTYRQVMEFHLGGPQTEIPRRIRHFLSWPEIAKFPQCKPHYYSDSDLEYYAYEIAKRVEHMRSHARTGPPKRIARGLIA